MGARHHNGRHTTRLTRLTRRDVLRLGGAGGAAMFLAGCTGGGNGGDSGDDAAQTPEPFPTGEAQVRWIQSPGAKEPFFDQWFEDYEAEHSNITVVNDVMPLDEISDVITVGVQNGNAHDVWISLPPGVTMGRAVREGWIAPLDDVVPDFEAWKAAFPENAFIEGVNMFDGQVYGCPVESSRAHSTLLLFNRQYMAEAGYDPASTTLTWDEWRDAARRITQAGDGDHFGWVLEGAQPPRLAELVADLATMAGSSTAKYQGVPFDFSTGEFNITNDEHLAAVELLLAMIDDGSLLPGSMGMNADQARNQAMTAGNAGMIVQGAWSVEVWERDFPDFDFGVGALPTPGTATPVGTQPGPAAQYLLNARSDVKAVAGDQFAYLGSPEGNRAYYDFVGVATAPIFPDSIGGSDLDERRAKVLELHEQLVRTRPEPAVRDAGVEEVFLQWNGVQPELGVNLQGILQGDLDAQEGLMQVQDAANEELDRAIEAAQDNGAEVSREDFVFSNWDLAQDYLPEHYEEL